jgi:hypothetical protein
MVAMFGLMSTVEMLLSRNALIACEPDVSLGRARDVPE